LAHWGGSIQFKLNHLSDVMLKANWMTLLPVSMLLAAASLADDAISTDTDPEPTPLDSRATTVTDAEREFSYLWQLRYPVATTAQPNDSSDSIASIEFQDTSMYGRVSQLRSLSFLTLAEFGQKRLFLGVNANGFVGIHFNAFSRADDQRYLEVARMPYLEVLDTSSDVDQPGPRSNNPAPQQMTDSW
jgi:hypothetical protein